MDNISHEGFVELDSIEDDRVLVDYDDFVAMVESQAVYKAKSEYILRALRIGIEPSVILDIFSDDEPLDISDFIRHGEWPEEFNVEPKTED